MTRNPNLAGHRQATEIATQELQRCGIEVVPMQEGYQGEVPSTVMGQLGDFNFKRAWYYWVVKGRVPLAVAQELHHSGVVAKQDIRVEGHCGCPEPEWPNASFYTQDDLLKILPASAKKECDVFLQSKSDSMREIAQNVLNHSVFSETDDPADYPGAQGFVESYHIDSELGLYIFVETLKKHNLVPKVTATPVVAG